MGEEIPSLAVGIQSQIELGQSEKKLKTGVEPVDVTSSYEESTTVGNPTAESIEMKRSKLLLLRQKLAEDKQSMEDAREEVIVNKTELLKLNESISTECDNLSKQQNNDKTETSMKDDICPNDSSEMKETIERISLDIDKSNGKVLDTIAFLSTQDG